MSPDEALTRAADRLEASIAYFHRADTDIDAASADVEEARDELLLAMARHLGGRDHWTFETAAAAVEYEDDGQAAIIEIGTGVEGDREFVRLHSWSEDRQHPMMEALLGLRVRVIVEPVD